MSDHLPECDKSHGGVQCICEELRACEQRVHTQEALKRIEAHKQGVAEGIKEGRTRIQQESKGSHKQTYKSGYSAGLAAARDAVAGALEAGLATSSDAALYFFELDEDDPSRGHDVTFHKESLLAAIDALRSDA